MSRQAGTDDNVRHPRPRTSFDVDRPLVDPRIRGIPQGWVDDPAVTLVNTSRKSPSKRVPLNLGPIRQRVKLSALGGKLKHSTLTHADTYPAPPIHRVKPIQAFEGSRPSSEGFWRLSRATGPGRFESGVKREWAEETSGVYRVGYEREILDLEGRLHEDMFLMQQSHIFAKLDRTPTRVLDIGTGLGLWPMSMAQEWTQAQFVGLDRAPCQVDAAALVSSWACDRISWEQANFLEPLPYPNESFDYVHMRFVGLGIPENAWLELIEEACRILEVGGTLEIVEMDYQIPLAPSPLQNAFTAQLVAYSVPDVPARSIKFSLPMLERVVPTSMQPAYHQDFEALANSISDAPSIWAVSALDYRFAGLNGNPVSANAWSDPVSQLRREAAKSGPGSIWAWALRKW